MILGLLSRKISGLPKIIELYSGDILWALMVFLMISFVFNRKLVAFIIVHNKADIPKDLKEVDLVIYGHSHKFSNEKIDNIVYLNYMI